MKERYSDKHPIMFSIMLGILLILFISIASATGQVLKFNNMGILVAQGAAFLLMAIIITIYMKKTDHSLVSFGFQKLQFTETRKVLYYIPLLIIALIHPMINGFDKTITATDIIIVVIFAFLVGYTEECIFRGIIKERLQSKSKTFFIIFSSTFFGILHMANALSGKDLTSVILQVVNAFLVGLILALLITVVNNIIPLIAFHFLYDTLAIMTASNNFASKESLTLIVLTSLYILYGIYLLFVLRGSQNVSQAESKSQGI